MAAVVFDDHINVSHWPVKSRTEGVRNRHFFQVQSMPATTIRCRLPIKRKYLLFSQNVVLARREILDLDRQGKADFGKILRNLEHVLRPVHVKKFEISDGLGVFDATVIVGMNLEHNLLKQTHRTYHFVNKFDRWLE